jgi:transposase
MDMHAAYREVGSYRAAAEICGTTPKTVKRSVEAARRAATGAQPGEVRHNYDGVAELVTESVVRTKGRITAKRLLPVATAAGYVGSARNFRRLVAQAKATWRQTNHRGRRPGVWSPGETVVFDWGQIGPLFVFCAVVAWSRFRFVYFTDNLGAEATMEALAACFETIGGVPKKALTDRMGCLKGATVAGLVIPTPAYVRFATHYGFRPDFCEGADPESKGLVENLVGYVKSDLMVPEQLSVADLARANTAAVAWCAEVNAAVHSEIMAVPAERLASEVELFTALPTLRAQIGKIVTRKVDKLSCVRFGSARYSVPNDHIGRDVSLRVKDGVIQVVSLGEIIATHLVVSPGETSIDDDHYGGARPAPQRSVRPKSTAEKAFCALGPVAEDFIKGAAAHGMTGLARDLEELTHLEAVHGREPVLAALERAVAFGRFRAADVVSILHSGAGLPRPTRSGEALIVELPTVPTRSLSDYAMGSRP